MTKRKLSRRPRAVDSTLTSLRVEDQHDAIPSEHVHEIAVDERCRHVRAASRHAPCDIRVRGLSRRQRNIADRCFADGVDRRHRAVRAGDVDEAKADDWYWEP